MATDFTIKQGETWSRVINLEDSDCRPVLMADRDSNPEMYFAGRATKSGETSIPLLFKYGDVESRTSGRGSNRYVDVGIFDVHFYIPADEVGSCSVSGEETQTECDRAGGIWTVNADASLLTTSNMAPGTWEYEVRSSVSPDSSGIESSQTMIYGNLIVEETSLDLSTGSNFDFIVPS
jgi:hypothetical protein